MSDKLYTQLKKHYGDALSLAPTRFDNPQLTRVYKSLSPYLKHLPFRVLIPVALLTSLLLYVVFGFFIIRLVSLFQYGF